MWEQNIILHILLTSFAVLYKQSLFLIQLENLPSCGLYVNIIEKVYSDYKEFRWMFS